MFLGSGGNPWMWMERSKWCKFADVEGLNVLAFDVGWFELEASSFCLYNLL